MEFLPLEEKEEKELEKQQEEQEEEQEEEEEATTPPGHLGGGEQEGSDPQFPGMVGRISNRRGDVPECGGQAGVHDSPETSQGARGTTPLLDMSTRTQASRPLPVGWRCQSR